ncbi:hypothetical protein AB0O91_10250 [Kitasatospora sp. NPDC089797]|uniref:hypothetical protein n=1 Tax=Kitasatospora sp. NPDC089797 TaxID=3155298 RepID=UPI00341E7D25
MANDQSETPVPSTPQTATQTEAPAAAVEAGKAVEGAVAAASNPTGYTAPTDADKAAFENGSFGDEGEYVDEPVGAPGGPLKPESIVGGHP